MWPPQVGSYHIGICYYGTLWLYIHWSGTARPVGFGATVRVDSDCFGGGQCHPQQNQFAIQNGHEVVPNLRKYCRYRYPWKWDETVIFHNNNRQTHKSIQEWTIFIFNFFNYLRKIHRHQKTRCVCVGRLPQYIFQNTFRHNIQWVSDTIGVIY